MRKYLLRRFVRYGLILLNAALLMAVVAYVFNNPRSSTSLQSGVFSQQTDKSSVVANPLDELSSADIAVQVASLARLPETTSVKNNADSQNEQLNVVSSGSQTIAKPQIVLTELKSKKDIKTYKTKSGDTVGNLASIYGVTSDSLKWSNGLTADALAADKVIYIPPVTGIAYEVKQGDTVDTLAQKYRANKDQIIADNDAEMAGLKVGERILIRDGSVPPPVVASVYTGGGGGGYGGFAWGGNTAIYAGNGYDRGWCTWYSAIRRSEIGKPVPSNLGNAYSWYRLAQRAGLPTGLTPAVGAVAVNEGGNHVSVVEVVRPDGSFIISEMNAYGSRTLESVGNPAAGYGGWNKIDYRIVPSSAGLKFIY